MFTNKIQILDINWNQLEVLKSKVKPSIGELIYSNKYLCYYKIITVIHSIKWKLIGSNSITLVVEKLDDINNKKNI